MDYNTDKVDEMVLALLFLTMCDEWRAWKGHDWDVLDRLHERGFIEDPRNKNKSVEFTEKGRKECTRLFLKHFGK